MNPDLDEMLANSRPTLAGSAEVDEAVEEMVHELRFRSRTTTRGRRRGVMIGAASAALVLVGTTAAAASVFGGWAPWAQEPDGAIAFRLPSGGACEYRIGKFESTDPELSREILSWLDDHTLGEIADVEGALRDIRKAGPQTWTESDGSKSKFGYGTEYYDADFEYADAVRTAVMAAINTKAEEIGGADENRLGNAGQMHCTGANTNPSVPSWLR